MVSVDHPNELFLAGGQEVVSDVIIADGRTPQPLTQVSGTAMEAAT